MNLLDTFLVSPLTALRDGLTGILGFIAFVRGDEDVQQYLRDLEEESVPDPVVPRSELLVVHSIQDYCERFPGHRAVGVLYGAFANCAQGMWVTRDGTPVAVWHPEDP